MFLVESTIGWQNEEEYQNRRMRTEQFSDWVLGNYDRRDLIDSLIANVDSISHSYLK
jgi:hypothetical protein